MTSQHCFIFCKTKYFSKEYPYLCVVLTVVSWQGWINSLGFKGHVNLQDVTSELLYGPAVQLQKCHLKEYPVTWWYQCDVGQTLWHWFTETT